MITLQITAVGSPAILQRLRRGLGGDAALQALHARIAIEGEELTKIHVAGIPDHDTANRLGATPTGHLAEMAKKISSESSAEQATIKIPRKSRLRAAFGSFDITPGEGKKYLTIPVARDSYGRRAGTFGDSLFFTRVGPLKQPVLARRQTREATPIHARTKVRMDNTKPLEVLYILVKKSHIKQQRNLLPSDEDYTETGRDTTIDYINELTEGGDQ